MSQNLETAQGREFWATRWGFILAAVGSAVGLGNIWGFSYQLGSNGGGAFLIIYLACILFIGFPLMMSEFMIGRRAKSDAVESFHKIAPGKKWYIAGGIGVAAAFFIMSFYSVIAGWTLKYFTVYLTGGVGTTDVGEATGYWASFAGNSVEPLIWHFIFMLLVVGIVSLGIKKGIEKANKFILPTLGLLILFLAIYSLTLGGTREALDFMFVPDWAAAFTNPSVFAMAMGQAMFTLSLGMGAMITYSSYIKQQQKLPKAAGTIVTLDTLFAIFAGLMIFPALFAFGGEPAGSVGLVFFALPTIFESMGGFGIVFGILFFFMLAIAALSSAISLIEVAVAYFMRKLGWARQKVTILLGSLIFIAGIPVSLSFGPLADFTIFRDYNFFGFVELFAYKLFLPIGGLIIVLFVGWGWTRREVYENSDFADNGLFKTFFFVLRYIVPVGMAIIIIHTIATSFF
ncbi:NSS family neurotransmitter:Na+ symporter [Evansella vedderi]|uniref:NSS family neurotransmitter:Na+ symporter n=1 Tax=Evansella vedderi TaxID=38282 RepID=A0ABT9ZP35_9BACI|nr:sodium-dependent transporter [Evansella vedderi]MDQ0253005.1 NSS family neurotransmitter:Na+ symporter [Evansella vedderi]